LQPVDVARRLAPNAIAGNIEDVPLPRDATLFRRQGINGIAGGRREDEIGKREPVRPDDAR
jgi:hypothetical protein